MVFSTSIVFFGVLLSVVYGSPVPPSGHQPVQPHIIGGEVAPEAYTPYMVALIFGDRVRFLICGGSIISSTLILSAAHCIEPVVKADGELLESFRILVGSNRWNSGGTKVKPEGYYLHPHWDLETIKNDIGVVILKERLEFNEKVAVIALEYGFVEGGERSLVAGWGITGPIYENNIVSLAPTPYALQKLYVNTISHEQCQEQMSSISSAAPLIQKEVEICTFHSYGVGMCSGDSGSALVRVSTRTQIGIVSWGFNCAEGAPDVFVRLCGMRDFLDPIMNKHKD